MRLRVTNISNGAVLARRVWVALSLWDRVRGLAGRPRLTEGDAFVLRPCRMAQTVGLHYAVVAIYLDEEGTVLAAPLLAPGRFGPYIRGTYLIIELPASRAGMVSPGDQIEIGFGRPDPTGTVDRRRRRVRGMRLWSLASGSLRIVS